MFHCDDANVCPSNVQYLDGAVTTIVAISMSEIPHRLSTKACGAGEFMWAAVSSDMRLLWNSMIASMNLQTDGEDTASEPPCDDEHSPPRGSDLRAEQYSTTGRNRWICPTVRTSHERRTADENKVRMSCKAAVCYGHASHMSLNKMIQRVAARRTCHTGYTGCAWH